MITLILCHKFSIGLRSGDFLANLSGPPYEIASTFSLTLLDGREQCHLEISSIHPEINFGYWQAILFPTQQPICWHSSSPHRCAIFQCHLMPYNPKSSRINAYLLTSWMLDSRRNALRAKRFMRSSLNKVVSSMILDSKGALITKYDVIPILTCPIQMLFCPSNPGFSLLFRYFWFLFHFASPQTTS